MGIKQFQFGDVYKDSTLQQWYQPSFLYKDLLEQLCLENQDQGWHPTNNALIREPTVIKSHFCSKLDIPNYNTFFT